LARRIDARVDEMLRQGLVAETQQLWSLGLAENRTAMQALGYRQVVDYLQGRCSQATAVARIKTRTRQYAKRQMTWFRNQMSLVWLDVPPAETPAQTAQRLLVYLGRPSPDTLPASLEPTGTPKAGIP
jgi:tRNA dimethylallyltransferase